MPATDELILRRTVNLEGRKTSYVNDKRCSGEILRKISEGDFEDLGDITTLADPGIVKDIISSLK